MKLLLIPLVLASLLAGSIPAGADLIAHWPLDADGSDASGNAHHGTVTGGSVNFAQPGANAATGQSAAFPDNGHIDIPWSQTLNPQSFTVALWANPTTTGGYASPITSRDDVQGGVTTHGFIIYNDAGGRWNFWTGNGNPGWDTLGGPAVATNTWIHLAISYDAQSNTKSLWINGGLYASDTAPNQYSPNGPEQENFHIGAGADGGVSFFFAGNIDDVGLWDEALSGTEINNAMKNGIDGMIAHDPKLTAGTGLDFGRLPANSDPVNASLALQNNGAANALDISGVSVTGADAANFAVTTHPATLAPGGGTGNIDVSFDPNGRDGYFTAQLEINSNDPVSPTVTVPLAAYVAISDPLVAWWPLDNDSTDASGNGFDGLDQGIITYSQPGASAASASAALFAGGGHIDIPWDAALNTRDFSVTLWTNADAAGGGHRSPVTNRDDVAPGGAYRHGWIIYKNPNGLWQFWNGGGSINDGAWNAASAGSVDFGNWHHIAITYDSFTNTKAFYVDGSLVTTSSPVAFSPNDSNIADGFTHQDEDLHIGGGGDAGTSFRWMGLIDDVGLFRTALSGDQVAAIMANGVGSLSSSTPFEIISVVRNSDTEVEITWNSKPGITYAVDRSTGQGTFNWGEVDDGTIGAGETASYTDSNIPAGSKDVFHRVRVVE
ncbi:MAG: LamG-like jellyroll fold domain-containing protein [Verrucomicrobiales bacterium]